MNIVNLIGRVKCVGGLTRQRGKDGDYETRFVLVCVEDCEIEVRTASEVREGDLIAVSGKLRAFTQVSGVGTLFVAAQRTELIAEKAETQSVTVEGIIGRSLARINGSTGVGSFALRLCAENGHVYTFSCEADGELAREWLGKRGNVCVTGKLVNSAYKGSPCVVLRAETISALPGKAGERGETVNA